MESSDSCIAKHILKKNIWTIFLFFSSNALWSIIIFAWKVDNKIEPKDS